MKALKRSIESNYELPKHWVQVNLIELLIALEAGSRPRGGVKGINSGIPSIGGEHLNSIGGFNFNKLKFIPQSFALRLYQGQIRPNDILIVKDGATTGKVSYIDNTFPFDQAFVNEHVFICRPSKFIEAKYLFWFLWSETGQKRILRNFKGSAQGGINSSFAQNTIVPLAPVEEQKLILHKIEDLINKKISIEQHKKEIEKLEEEAFRSFIYSGIQPFASLKLASYCKERKARIGEKWENIKLIGVSNELGITKLRTGSKLTFETYKIVQPGDFIYNPMRVDIGSIAIWDGEQIALTSPDYVVFYITNTISPQLLLKFLKSPLGLSEIKNNTKGSVRSRLYFNNLSNINFPFCGKERQDEAQSILSGFLKINQQALLVQQKVNEVIKEKLKEAFSISFIFEDLRNPSAQILLRQIREEKQEYIKTKKIKSTFEKNNHVKKKELPSKTILQILKDTANPISAKELWEQSEFRNNIDEFYSNLKKLMETNKKVIEIKKGKNRYIILKNEN